MARLLADLGIEDRKTRILDVGCGVGAMMAGLAAAGFTEIWGTEYSDYRVAASRSRFPGRIFAGGYAGVPDDLGFDVIYSNHVLEHIAHPADAIDRIAARLNTGGILVLTVPDAWSESVMNQVFFLPHLHSFSALSMVRIAEHGGFRAMFWKGSRWYELTAVLFREPAFRPLRPDCFVEPGQGTAGRSGSQSARFREAWDSRGRGEGYRSFTPYHAGSGYSVPGPMERASVRALKLAHTTLSRLGLDRLRSRLPFKTGYLHFRSEGRGDGAPSLSLPDGQGVFHVK